MSYKITKPQVNTALNLLKQNEQLTMNELLVDMKQKYKEFDITFRTEIITKPEKEQGTSIFQKKDIRNLSINKLN